jgi:hypothetical protein
MLRVVTICCDAFVMKSILLCFITLPLIFRPLEGWLFTCVRAIIHSLLLVG